MIVTSFGSLSSVLLKSSRLLDDIRLCDAEPEVLVSFDPFKGGDRNCDLLVHGVCKRGKLVISVEAKADERFDSSVGRKFDIGERTERSKLPERIRRLTSAVLDKSVAECRELRYQLLQGTAAALSAAAKHEAAIAIFVVHEFVTECTGDANHQKNAEDLNRFVSALSGVANQQVRDGVLLGPFLVPGNAYIPASVQLFIGKATRNTRPNRLGADTGRVT